MQTRLPVEWILDAGATENTQSPKVLIIYDDLPAGKNAVQVLKNVFEQCYAICDLRPMLWKFELLEDPEWSSRAFGDALQADIVVIATNNDLTAGVQTWIERFCKDKTGTDTAIAALCGPQSNGVRSVERAARNARLEFFAPSLPLDHSAERWTREPECSPDMSRSVETFIPLTTNGRTAQPYQHWGINE